MSEERIKDEDVDGLKEELKDWIDLRIGYNIGFTNLLRWDPLFVSIISLFLSVYGVWRFGFLAEYYVLSVYLICIVSLSCSIINGILNHSCETTREKGNEKRGKDNRHESGLDEDWCNSYQKEVFGLMRRELMDKECSWIKNVNLYFTMFRPIFFSFWILFLLCFIVLWVVRDFRWWLWTPAILFALFLPPIATKGGSFLKDLYNLISLKEDPKIELSTKTILFLYTILFILFILTVAGIYLCYHIVRELIFIAFLDIYSLFGIIFTMILIFVGFASLSEYLSMKFIMADVSKQNYALYGFRMMIDRIEDTKVLRKHKNELLKWYLPKTESYLVFFNYYRLMPVIYTFEVGEEE